MKREIVTEKREENDELLEQIKSNKVTDVTEMPACKKVEISRIPSPLPFQAASIKNKFEIDFVSVEFKC